jgi:hypothetical protein
MFADSESSSSHMVQESAAEIGERDKRIVHGLNGYVDRRSQSVHDGAEQAKKEG